MSQDEKRQESSYQICPITLMVLRQALSRRVLLPLYYFVSEKVFTVISNAGVPKLGVILDYFFDGIMHALR